jgi:hypothetical protein
MMQPTAKKKEQWVKKWGVAIAGATVGVVALIVAVAVPGPSSDKKASATTACKCVAPQAPSVGQPLCTYTIARCGCPASLPGHENRTACQLFPETELCYPAAGQDCGQFKIKDNFVKSCSNNAAQCRSDGQCKVETQVEERACAPGPVVTASEVYNSCEDAEQQQCRGACMLQVTAGGKVHYFKGKCTL